MNCPDCGRLVTDEGGHGEWCMNPSCKWGWEVPMDIPLCGRCAETWFCERNHLPEIACVVCAMRPKIDDILAVVWSQHLEADYVCHLEHCPFCKLSKQAEQERVALDAFKSRYPILSGVINDLYKAIKS